MRAVTSIMSECSQLLTLNHSEVTPVNTVIIKDVNNVHELLWYKTGSIQVTVCVGNSVINNQSV